MKKVILILLLLQSAFLFPQDINKLDQLEKRLNELRNTNPDEVIKIGDYILEHSSSNRQKANTLVFMSFAYFAKKDTDKSTELLFKAKEIAEATKDSEVITKIYGTIAQMYLKIEFKDKASHYLQMAIDEIQKMPESDSKHRLKGLSYIELGKINLDDKKNTEANAYFKRSLAEFNLINENSLYFIKRSYYNLGDSFHEMNKPDSAKFYLKKALDIEQNPVVNRYILFTLSNVYTQEKQYQRAIDTLSAVLDRYDLEDDIKSKVYLAILKNYNAVGNTEKYNQFNERYLALNNEISNTNLSTIKNVIKIEEKDFTKKITSAHQQNNRLLFLLVVIFVSGSAILLYIRQKKKLQKKKYEAIIDQLEKKSLQVDFPQSLLPAKDNTASSGILPEIEQGILDKLLKFEQSDKFTNPKLNISTVSIQLKTNTTYLSQIINKYKGKNFSTYINELRINYICEKIHNNPEYLAYKISYLGEMAGFTSHSTFTTTFKSVTGMSPSTFLKEADKRVKSKKND